MLIPHEYKQDLQDPVIMSSHEVFVMYFRQTSWLINVHEKNILSATWAVTIQHSSGCPSTTSSSLKLSIMSTKSNGRGSTFRAQSLPCLRLDLVTTPATGPGRNGEGMKVTGKPNRHKNISSWSLPMHMHQGQQHELLTFTDAFIGGSQGNGFKGISFRGGSGDLHRRKIQNKIKREVLDSIKSELSFSKSLGSSTIEY